MVPGDTQRRALARVPCRARWGVTTDAFSVCTGVGGIDLGLERAGWRIVAQCEKDAYRRAVLARHWPGVPCFEDIREVTRAQFDGRRGQLGGEHRGADGGERPK